MSSSSAATGDSGKFSGNKMSFSQTCNLLGQFVKEKRAFGISGNIDGLGAKDGYNGPTMNLFPVSGKSAEDSNGCIGRTINIFPQLSGFNRNPVEAAPLKANACSVNKVVNTEPPAAPMTIFYAGQVIVFNDLPENKAKEVMDLASSYESSLKKRKLEPTSLSPPVPVPVRKTNPNPSPNQNLNVPSNFGNKAIPAPMPQPSVANVSDLPIARKASLHRFLEKRKDRLVCKPPTSSNVPNGASSKPMESQSWLGLGSMPVFQSQQQL